MNRRIIRAVLCLILAAGIIGAGYFFEGYVQEIALVPASAFITVAVTDLIFILNSKFGEPVFIIRSMTISVLFLVIVLVFETYLLLKSWHVPPFPDDGLIADFQSGTGAPARTAFDTQCRLFSDSAFNLDSKVWYRRIDDNFNGGGHLHIEFQLDGQGAGQPYVGVYCPFSFEPATGYDISRFKALTFDAGLATKPEMAHLLVGVAIFSAGTPLDLRKIDAHPAYEIEGDQLQPVMRPRTIFLTEFKAPPFIRAKDELDTKGVFGIAFVITGLPKSGQVTGSLDLGHIRFQ